MGIEPYRLGSSLTNRRVGIRFRETDRRVACAGGVRVAHWDGLKGRMTSWRLVVVIGAIAGLAALGSGCSGVTPGSSTTSGNSSATNSNSTTAPANAPSAPNAAANSGQRGDPAGQQAAANTVPGVAAAVPTTTASPDANAARIAPGTATELRLSGGDKVRVTVYGEDKISGEYQIDSAGLLSIPLAGSIQGAGLTKVELEQALTQKLKSEYLRNPRVTIEVISYRPFYVLGEVKSPGEYQFRSGLNVLSAIAIAGGATYRANNSTVMIQRFGSTELKEFPQSPTVLVLPGDVVRVPERFF
jgi:protein involved in polysaccharide export with SLBB domain